MCVYFFILFFQLLAMRGLLVLRLSCVLMSDDSLARVSSQQYPWLRERGGAAGGGKLIVEVSFDVDRADTSKFAPADT